MNDRIITVALVAGIVFTLIAIVFKAGAYHYLGNQQDYEPVQPIAYSHLLHAGELEIPCMYCHFGARKSRHAGIPGASVCMNCHRFVNASYADIQTENRLAEKEGRKRKKIISPQLQKLYDALGLDENMKADPNKKPTPIKWIKVHNAPDFVHFDHRPHVLAEVECQKCHGPVQTMKRIRQVKDLSMGWCVNCHRDVNVNGVNGKRVAASVDCVACHY